MLSIASASARSVLAGLQARFVVLCAVALTWTGCVAPPAAPPAPSVSPLPSPTGEPPRAAAARPGLSPSFESARALLAYLEAPSPRSRDAVLRACLACEARAPYSPLNGYILAFIRRERKEPALEEAVAARCFPARRFPYRFFFVERRSELPALLRAVLAECCYVERVNQRFEWMGERGGLRRPDRPPLCPVTQRPFDMRETRDHGMASVELECSACDAVRRVDRRPFQEVFAQVAWDAHGRDRLSGWREVRDQIIPIEVLLDDVGIRPGLVVADIGCGEGYFTFPLAQRVGPNGRVHAVEIEADYLDFIARRARAEGLANITTRRSKPADVSLPPDSIDVAFVCEVYKSICRNAQIHDEAVLRTSVDPFVSSIRRALRKGGRLIVIEHDPPPGDPKGMDVANIVTQLEARGFRRVKESTAWKPRKSVIFFEPTGK